ncbi:MAG: hypothetical protein IJT87_06400 [Ruminiclostridium sp.]|nr:hypothetical protein [Ruminiclostridium sp.]
MTRSETIVFEKLPETADELRKMPQATLEDPFKCAALVAAIMCRYESNMQDCIDMMNVMRGSRYLTPYDVQLMRDRLGGRGCLARSYFEGARPENGYKPDIPYTVVVKDTPDSYSDRGFIKLYIKSSGDDIPRQVLFRQKGEKWYLWENFLMLNIEYNDWDEEQT